MRSRREESHCSAETQTGVFRIILFGLGREREMVRCPMLVWVIAALVLLASGVTFVNASDLDVMRRRVRARNLLFKQTRVSGSPTAARSSHLGWKRVMPPVRVVPVRTAASGKGGFKSKVVPRKQKPRKEGAKSKSPKKERTSKALCDTFWKYRQKLLRISTSPKKLEPAVLLEAHIDLLQELVKIPEYSGRNDIRDEVIEIIKAISHAMSKADADSRDESVTSLKDRVLDLQQKLADLCKSHEKGVGAGDKAGPKKTESEVVCDALKKLQKKLRNLSTSRASELAAERIDRASAPLRKLAKQSIDNPQSDSDPALSKVLDIIKKTTKAVEEEDGDEGLPLGTTLDEPKEWKEKLKEIDKAVQDKVKASFRTEVERFKRELSRIATYTPSELWTYAVEQSFNEFDEGLQGLAPTKEVNEIKDWAHRHLETLQMVIPGSRPIDQLLWIVRRIKEKREKLKCGEQD